MATRPISILRSSVMSYILIFTGLVSPLVAIALMFAFYYGSERRKSSEKSFESYFGGSICVAIVVGILVAINGRWVCRLMQFPDEILGWIIPLFFVPLITSIAVTTYCIFWVEGLIDPSTATATTPPATLTILPPATEDIQFSDDEARLMQRLNIFFNGQQFRFGTQNFDTLAEALAAATDSGKVGV